MRCDGLATGENYTESLLASPCLCLENPLRCKGVCLFKHCLTKGYGKGAVPFLWSLSSYLLPLEDAFNECQNPLPYLVGG
jgi:hypothetical protein